jgi:hypothetical protein
MAISYEAVTCHVYGNSGSIHSKIVIPFYDCTDWNQHDLVVRNTEKLMLIGLVAEEHESGGLFIESILHDEIVKTLDRYKALHAKYDSEETMSDGGHKRIGRRESVKMVASSILDDIGDAFDESNWESDEDDQKLSEEEKEEEEEEEEEKDEIWDEHYDEGTNTKYYVGRQSRRR